MAEQKSFRVFLSAVSNELASWREDIARVLRRKGIEVREQKHFRQGGGTLVEALRDYIVECDAVIFLIGEQCGSIAGAEHAAVLGANGFFDRFRAATGDQDASYTQWEFFLAKESKRKTYVFFTGMGFVPDRPPKKSSRGKARQARYTKWVKKTGENYGTLTTVDKLIEDVLVLPFPDLSRPKPIHLPYPSLGKLFKGRDEFLLQLRKSLRRTVDGRAAAIVGKALHGLGGVGKTRLAVEYAWQHADDYSAVLFVTAETPEGLRRNLAELVGPMILDLPEQNETDEEKLVAAALRWLNEHPGFFLILDNADTEEAAEHVEALLARLRGGQVLITSRLGKWSGCVDSMELDVLEHVDAKSLLLARTASDSNGRGRRNLPSDDPDSAELARELGGLALALEQAGAYINRKRISFADYLLAWRAHEPAVQKWHEPRTMKYPRSIAVTWKTTLDQLGLVETALLNILAWFAPEPVPQTVIEKAPSSELSFPADANIGRLSEESVREALETLADFNMIQWDVQAATVTVHRVVQEIIRIRQVEPDLWLTNCLNLLNNSRPRISPSDVRTWSGWEPLRPHVAFATSAADDRKIDDPTSKLMGELGLLLKAKALYAEAEPLTRRALAIDEQSCGAEHPEVAIRLNNLSTLLQDTSRLTEAEPLMRRALAIDEKFYGAEHPNVAIDLCNLAQLLQDTNRLAEAEPLMRRALAIDEQFYGAEHPDVAIGLNNLAQLLQDTNRLREAEPLMRRALAIDEQSYGFEHPEVATDLNNIAHLLSETNRLAEAEPLLRRALTIGMQSVGPDHAWVANPLNNLALLLQATNRLSEAEPLMRRALDIVSVSLGDDHPSSLKIARNYRLLLTAIEESKGK